MGAKTTSWKEFSSTTASAIIYLTTNQKFNFSRKPKRNDTQVPQPSALTDNVANEVVHKKLGNKLVRAATTASSLEAEHDIGNITKTQSKATPNESSSQGTNSGGGPRCQETIEDTTAQTRRVKKLEQRNRSRTHKLKRLYKVSLTARVESSRDEESLGEDASKLWRRIDIIDVDDEITLVNDAHNEMFYVDDLGGNKKESLLRNSSRMRISLSESQSSSSMLGGIGSSGVKDKSISFMKESLSSTGIGNRAKDSIAASEFSEINSSGGRGDELSYNNLLISQVSSSGSQSVSLIPGGINLRRVGNSASD
nr:hypothetical protein [Tanacetum cinerariifolium]